VHVCDHEFTCMAIGLLNIHGITYHVQLLIDIALLKAEVTLALVAILRYCYHHRLLRQNGNRYKYVHKIHTKIQR